MNMAKGGKKQIYEDEKKVIAELQKNARESISKIAENCGFSYQKVGRIIHNLRENKKIWGYYAVADNEELNLNRYIILIKRSTEPIDNAISKIIDLTVKKFSDILTKEYHSVISEIHILEDIFSVKKCGMAKFYSANLLQFTIKYNVEQQYCVNRSRSF